MESKKYTPEQLAEMAERCLCAWNLNDPRANAVVAILSAVKRMHPEAVIAELHKLCEVK